MKSSLLYFLTAIDFIKVYRGDLFQRRIASQLRQEIKLQLTLFNWGNRKTRSCNTVSSYTRCRGSTYAQQGSCCSLADHASLNLRDRIFRPLKQALHFLHINLRRRIMLVPHHPLDSCWICIIEKGKRWG